MFFTLYDAWVVRQGKDQVVRTKTHPNHPASATTPLPAYEALLFFPSVRPPLLFTCPPLPSPLWMLELLSIFVHFMSYNH